MKTSLIPLLLIAALTGCADHIAESKGTAIQVIPTTYQFELNTREPAKAKARVIRFTSRYPQTLSQAHWLVVTSGQQGDALYQSVHNKLIELGVMPQQIEHKTLVHQGRFNLAVSATIQKVKLEVCHQEHVGSYGEGTLGCNTDSSRWQSMVNPHNAI